MELKFYDKQKGECVICGMLMPYDTRLIQEHYCSGEQIVKQLKTRYEISQMGGKKMDEKQILMSENLNELAAALAKAQALMEPAKKDEANPFFKSKYADLASVWNACRGPLSANGLSVTQLTSTNGSIVTVTTLLLHASGQYISSVLSMQADKATPQGIGSAITYARRYALSAIVGISAEDDDGNAASGIKHEITEKVNENGSKTILAKQVLPVDYKDKFDKARKLLGDNKFFQILGNEGYEKAEEITNTAVAKQILEDMGEAYKASKGEK